VIRLNDTDPGFKYELAAVPGGEGIRVCFGCGACSARCQVAGHHPDYDPRRIIRMVLMGMRAEVLASPLIWLCSTCYNCHEVCPQGVGFAEVLAAITNLAVAEGKGPASAGAVKNLLASQGRLLEVSEFENEKRTKMGLAEVEGVVEEIGALLGGEEGR